MASRGIVELPDRGADDGRVVGQGDLHQPGPALLQLEEADEAAHRQGLLGQGQDQVRGGHRHVDTPVLVEQPLVLGVIDPGHHPGHGELLLGQQRDHQVVLVVAGGRHHDVDRADVGLPQRRHLAGVGGPPLDAAAVAPRAGEGGGGAADHARVLLDDQDLVAGHGEVVGDELADVAGAGDGNLHWCTGRGTSGPSRPRAVRSGRRGRRWRP